MEEKQLQSFVDSVVNYFDVQPGDDVSVGTPYLLDKNKSEAADFFSGIIAVSGSKVGWVRYSAPRIMVKHLLLSMGEKDTSDGNVKDLVGEVANTISGNLRKYFGSQFLISVPKIVQGQDIINSIDEKQHCYVVPIYWRHYHSSMVVYLH